MKASEAIARLQELIEEHGDLPFVDNIGFEIENIDYDGEEDEYLPFVFMIR